MVGLQAAPSISLALEPHPTAGTRHPRGRQGLSQSQEEKAGQRLEPRQGSMPEAGAQGARSIPPAPSLPLPQAEPTRGNFCARGNGPGTSECPQAARLKVRGEENKAWFP